MHGIEAVDPGLFLAPAVDRAAVSLPADAARMNFRPLSVLKFVRSFHLICRVGRGGSAFGSRRQEMCEVMRPFDIPIANATT